MSSIKLGSDLRDWSIDIETMDTKFSAAVLSIGAVQFNRDTGQLGIEFYKEVTIDSAVRAGTVSGSTVTWGIRTEAWLDLFRETSEKVPLVTALDELAALIRSKTIGPRVWGNGASFDITILEHAYVNGTVSLAIPWSYQNIRDMRTTVDDAGLELHSIPSVGAAHNALADAKFQAVAISLARRRIRRALGETLPPWAGPNESRSFDSPLKFQKGSPPGKAATTPVPAVEDDDDEL
ncbi:MAG: 3'-5' exoribonuclease [Chromatiales bacterium]|nr:3'-5' exoribonuclease [Chromatiales bacterium]